MSGGSLGLGLRSGSYGSLQQYQQQQQLQQQQQHQQPQINSFLLPNHSLSPSPSPFINRKQAKMLKEKEKVYYWLCKAIGRKKVGMLFLAIVSTAVFVWVVYVGKGEDSTVREGPPSIRFSNNKTFNSNESLPASTVHETIETKPRKYFTGYTLPSGNPCETFTLPPPPADKKRIGPRPCPVCYLDQEQAMSLMPDSPSYSPVYNLTYVYEDQSSKTEFGGSEFGGYPSLKQREDSYDIRDSMNVHCGFVKGPRPGHGTGFDINDVDFSEMEECKGIVVASAIFGNYDLLQQPKNVSEAAKRDVCFFMFFDEETEAAMRNASILGTSNKVGLWRIVVVRNLPYTDSRRNGKVPKLLLHRLFPNARYSIWMDGKLELVEDPYRILERFLWRANASFAISRHYRRFDVFVEAEANKAAAKYDNASIDFQIEFYKKEGLTPYSLAKLPITSDVPEGCVIIREHVPISNLFGCLWFNEVDRFTSRDQISFSTVRDNIRKKVDWTVSMFLDCERRNFVVQGYHKDVLAQKEAQRLAAIHPPVIRSPPPPLLSPPPPPSPLLSPPPPPPPAAQSENLPTRRNPPRRGRGRRRNRKVAAGTGTGTTTDANAK